MSRNLDPPRSARRVSQPATGGPSPGRCSFTNSVPKRSRFSALFCLIRRSSALFSAILPSIFAATCGSTCDPSSSPLRSSCAIFARFLTPGEPGASFRQTRGCQPGEEFALPPRTRLMPRQCLFISPSAACRRLSIPAATPGSVGAAGHLHLPARPAPGERFGRVSTRETGVPECGAPQIP